MMKEKALEILSNTLKNETTHYMNRCIIKHLMQRVEESDALAEEICQEWKSYDKCIKYVYQAAYDKMALGLKDGKIDTSKCTKLDNGAIAYGDQLDDQFTYEAAEDYYHLDDYEQWKKEQEEAAKKKAEAAKSKAKSKASTAESTMKKAVKAMNEAADKLATDPQNEKLCEAYVKAVETADKAKADYAAAKAEYEAAYPDEAKEKPEKKRKSKKADDKAENIVQFPAPEADAAEDDDAISEAEIEDADDADVPAETEDSAAEEAEEAAETEAEDESEEDSEASEESETTVTEPTAAEPEISEPLPEPQPRFVTVNDYSESKLYVAFKDEREYRDNAFMLNTVLAAHPGTNEAYAYISNPRGQMKLDDGASLSDTLVAKLKDVFGEANIFCSKVKTKEVEVSAAPKGVGA